MTITISPGALTMKTALIFAAVLSIVTAAASAEAPVLDLPSEFSYTIYVEGERAGSSTTKVTETAEGYILESHVLLKRADFRIDLKARTEVDKRTLLPLKFEYSGTKSGNQVEGEAIIEGKDVYCSVVENDEKFPTSRESRHPKVLVLEDYVMDHEVLLALAFARSGEDPANFGLLFPSICNVTAVSVTKGSELALESETQEAICEKYVVMIEGSSAFASFFDPQRGLPVYLAFPTTYTEVFLDDFFGDTPITRYRNRQQ
jgi:hypothetical protein